MASYGIEIEFPQIRVLSEEQTNFCIIECYLEKNYPLYEIKADMPYPKKGCTLEISTTPITDEPPNINYLFFIKWFFNYLRDCTDKKANFLGTIDFKNLKLPLGYSCKKIQKNIMNFFTISDPRWKKGSRGKLPLEPVAHVQATYGFNLFEDSHDPNTLQRFYNYYKDTMGNIDDAFNAKFTPFSNDSKNRFEAIINDQKGNAIFLNKPKIIWKQWQILEFIRAYLVQPMDPIDSKSKKWIKVGNKRYFLIMSRTALLDWTYFDFDDSYINLFCDYIYSLYKSQKSITPLFPVLGEDDLTFAKGAEDPTNPIGRVFHTNMKLLNVIKSFFAVTLKTLRRGWLEPYEETEKSMKYNLASWGVKEDAEQQDLIDTSYVMTNVYDWLSPPPFSSHWSPIGLFSRLDPKEIDKAYKPVPQFLFECRAMRKMLHADVYNATMTDNLMKCLYAASDDWIKFTSSR